MAFSGDTDDLATLSRLDEQVLVDQLHRRYDADKIYVRVFSLIFSDFVTFSIALSLISISADLHRRHSGRCQSFPPTGNLYSKGQFTCLFSRVASQSRSIGFAQFSPVSSTVSKSHQTRCSSAHFCDSRRCISQSDGLQERSMLRREVLVFFFCCCFAFSSTDLTVL